MGFLALGIGHADHPDGGTFPTAVVGPGLYAERRGGERMVTPVQSDCPANILRAVPSARLGWAGLLVGDGDPNPTPIFPVESDSQTIPDGRNLAVDGPCLSRRPTTLIVGFRLIHVRTVRFAFLKPQVIPIRYFSLD